MDLVESCTRVLAVRWVRSLVAMATAVFVATALVNCGSGSDGGGGDPTPTSGAPTPSPRPPTPTPEPTALPTPQPTATAGGIPALRLTTVGAGFQQPLFVTSAPGDADHLYVVEQTGRIRLLAGDGSIVEPPFVDLSEAISCCIEQGLLGLAFHPDYAESGRLFVNYTNRDGDTEVVELARSQADPRRADPTPVRTFFRIEQPFPNHNGGMLGFAPDGTLVVATGDGGGAGDPEANAQDLSSKLGKLLRIDVDTHPEPPQGNVPGADPDVWHYGLRNPWRFAFDRATGDLWIGDVGQNRFEEIDVVPAGVNGLDFGWPELEGRECFRPASDCERDGSTLPVLTYGRDLGGSVTGGIVYRGRRIPGLVGHYLFGDFLTNRVWAVAALGGDAPATELTPALDPERRLRGLSSFGEDAEGEAYVVSFSGDVFRIDADPVSAGSEEPR